MKDQFKRFRFAPIASGAYGPTGGHVRVLGIRYAWVNNPTWGSKEFRIWRLFEIKRYVDGEWQWGVSRLEFNLKMRMRSVCRVPNS